MDSGWRPSVPPLPSRLPLDSATRQHVQHLPDRLLTIGELRESQVFLYLIAIAPTLLLLDDVAGIGQIGDEGVRMPLGDVEVGRNVA